ncbi:LysR family transcriptional regulator [Nitrospirillum sp. BR 11828]|uniref:LysR family transcriptional regulator n=1 Tax=Nitrospirillum sp. BR 11828 TaxID=3104325 RepID=UPI002ACADC8D|nr:LysR family transcriptional regulator [Nitrospirillum sp. BR 11828]MDZ5649730.1 LysR family transcriptional regulator [Nitrospirillum sp. BR 11828]
MNLVQLKRVIAIYETGSLRKASQVIGVTQPALTSSIKQLEEELNTSLFERGPTGVRPTGICEKLVQRARLLLSEEQRIINDIAEVNKVPRLAVGIHPIMMNEGLAKVMAAFVERSPNVDLRIREGYTSQLLKLLSIGELDFALCGLPEDYRAEDFQFDSLITQEYAIVVVAGHPILRQIADGAPFSNFTWALVNAYDRPEAIDQNQDVLNVMRKFGYTDTSKSIKSSSIAFVKHLILHGQMIGMIAREAVAQELKSGAMRCLEGSEIPAPAFGFITLRDRYEPKMARQMKFVIRQWLTLPTR